MTNVVSSALRRNSLTVGAVALIAALTGCGSSGSSSSGTGGSAAGQAGAKGSGGGGLGGSAGTGAMSGAAGANGSGSGGTMAGGMGGMPMPGMGGMPGPGMGGMMGMTATGGAAGAATTCTPGVQQTVIVDCGYPTTTSDVLTSVTFNESAILRAIEPSGAASSGVVKLFYNDEHALTLGIRSVAVKSTSGTTTTNYTVSALSTDPGSVTSPQTGTNILVGDQSGLDQSLRPMWPVLFITDVSTDPTSRVGDWQQGGVPTGPNAVYGSWKAAVRNVDDTVSPSKVTITPDADPAKNDWTLDSPDTAPTGLMDQGYGAEVVWSVPFIAGHSYRVQVLIHDGDQNQSGGDSGEACVLFCAGSGSCESTGTCGGGSGGSGGGSSCPSGTSVCGANIDGVTCPSGSVCANGCCLPIIPIG